jgi:type IV pilus assembly protein PilN
MMLKINLLPTAPKRAGGQQGPANHLRIFAAALSITLVLLASGIMVFHSGHTKKLDDATSANGQREAAVRAMRARVADHDRVRHDLEEIRTKQDAIRRLEANRTGPTAMLIEISQILSPGGRPTNAPSEFERIQRDDPTRWMRPTWDTHLVWLTMFNENERAVSLDGYGKSADDVAEFMRRLMLSQYFEAVTLERSEGFTDPVSSLNVQRFKITTRARY